MTQAASWAPDVEQRLHPFGEAGVTSSLEEVCKRVSRGAAGILGSGEQVTRVRAWAIEQLHAARGAGERVVRPGDRARVLLEAVQKKKIWVPDPVGTEHIFDAKHLTCDDHDEYGVCVKGGDCDDVVTALAACFMSVGLYTMIVGHSYSRNHVIGHVLTKVYFDGKWHYADPSPLADGKYMPLGKCAPFTREMYYSLPEIRVVCDGETCDRQEFDPNELGFVQQGTFVGVNGIPVFEMPPRVEWLGEAQPIVEWLGAPRTDGYSGYDKLDNPLTKEIIKRDGAVDEESLKAYGKVAGTIAGAGACAALGVTAPVAGTCGVIGGIIGEWLASKIPVAKGSTLSDLQAEVWKEFVTPYLVSAQKVTVLGVSYLTLRDKMLSDAEALGVSKQWSNEWLTSKGYPPAPLQPRWEPQADRWNGYSEWMNKGDLSYPKGGAGVATFSSMCAAAKSAGINLPCREYIFLIYGGFPPVSAPGDPIDWGLIAAEDFWALHGFKNHKDKGYTDCFFVPWSAQGPASTGSTGQKYTYVNCPSPSPLANVHSVWLRGRLDGLRAQREEFFSAVKTAPRDMSVFAGSSTSSAGGTIVKLGLGAGALWGAFELLKYLKVFR